MPRTARPSIGEICHHVLNRGNAQQDVFHEDDDRAPHGPGIQAATLRTPTNRGEKSRMSPFPHGVAEEAHLLFSPRFVGVRGVAA